VRPTARGHVNLEMPPDRPAMVPSRVPAASLRDTRQLGRGTLSVRCVGSATTEMSLRGSGREKVGDPPRPQSVRSCKAILRAIPRVVTHRVAMSGRSDASREAITRRHLHQASVCPDEEWMFGAVALPWYSTRARHRAIGVVRASLPIGLRHPRLDLVGTDSARFPGAHRTRGTCLIRLGRHSEVLTRFRH